MAKKKSKMKKYEVSFRFGGIMIVTAQTKDAAVRKVQNMSKKKLMESAKFFQPDHLSYWEVDRVIK